MIRQLFLLMLLLACVVASPAWAQTPAAAPTSGERGSAVVIDGMGHPADNTRLVTKDATGHVTGSVPNPEASVPLFGDKRATGNRSAQKVDPFRQFISILLKLALVLLVAYIVMLGLRKYTQSGGRLALPGSGLLGGGRPQLLSIKETASLGQGRSLALVRVGNRHFLVGVTPQHVTLLGDVSGDAAIVPPAPEPQRGEPQNADFARMLSHLMAPNEPAAPPQVEVPTPPPAGISPAAASLLQAWQAHQKREGDR